MTYTRAEALNFWAGLLVATLICVGALAPQLRAADARADAYRGQVESLNLQVIRGCTAHPDGSGTCRPGSLLQAMPVLP